MSPIYVWLIVFVLTLLVEAITMGLTSIWFAGGSLIALLMAWSGFGVPAQIVVFQIVSITLLVVTRPIAKKYLNKERQKTNAESLIGKQALVVEDIDTLQGKGVVEVAGMEWSAKTEELEGHISKNTVVTIEGIQGVKLIVKEKER